MIHSKGAKVRQPIVEGIFYPENSTDLESLVEDLLEKATIEPDEAFAIISPHAGYEYAGSMNADAFKASARRKINTVVLLAPVHREIDEEVALPESEEFYTPLGSVEVEQDIVEDILSFSTSFARNDIPHLEEHSIEVQLPFIQKLFPKARIVPILIGNAKEKSLKVLTNALQISFQDRFHDTLLVASSNMSSYKNIEKSKIEADRNLELILKLNGEDLASSVFKGEISSCGARCIVVLLSLRGMSYTARVLSRGCSSDAKKRGENSVHYAAVALYSDVVKG